MAVILPSHPTPGLSKTLARLIRSCRKKLPESYTLRVILRPGAGQQYPHLLLSNPQQILGIWVWEDPAEQIQAYLSGQQELGLSADKQLEALAQRHQQVAHSPIPQLILYAQLSHIPNGSSVWHSPEYLLSQLQPCPKATQEQFLESCCPENRVLPSLTVRDSPQRLEATHTHFLLDATQEDAVKRDLFLPPAQENIAKEFKPRIIVGVAGSGKSLILLYRMRLYRQFFPQRSQRSLILTHNKALCEDLAWRYQQLFPEDQGQVEISTFMSWFMKHSNQRPFPEPMSVYRRNDHLKEAYRAHLQESRITLEQFDQELSWLKDQGLPSREQYHQLARSGQGFALRSQQRDSLYFAVEHYQQALARRGEIDWHDIPLHLWKRTQQGEPLFSRPYDVIFVDEAQFCAPIWFDIIRSALSSEQANLFFVADPTQGFLRRKQSWVSLGFQVRGRILRLEKSYRTTQELMSFATMLYRRRQPEDQEAVLASDISHLPNGPMPIILPLRSPHDEITKVQNEIEAYLAQGRRGREMLVIHCSSQGARSTLQRLQKRFGEQVCDPRSPDASPEAIRILSLDAATGLESPIVFLLGAHQLYEQEQALRLSDEERQDRIRQNTKRLYTAITRAGNTLLISYCGPVPEELIPEASHRE